MVRERGGEEGEWMNGERDERWSGERRGMGYSRVSNFRVL